MYEYDRGLALMHVADAARLLPAGRCRDRRAAGAGRSAAGAGAWCGSWRWTLGGGYYVSDWTRIHANFFRSIEMTKSMLFVILSMIVAMAAFNIVATLVMVVKEKQTDIAILRTLGAAPRNILRVFAVQGVLHRPGGRRGRHRAGRAAVASISRA